ncbi:class I SAM-dependent methyltransferase [Kangiella sediminilitoris]|uniref:Methyltransferase n=1 Tax=Kangiella sediminilitoris TaxID=1144748 RepID=A0A1B3BC86_9GAMM|nr:methyltransferase [Kangiella sediminilitoris]AOE50426.1 methyltransferase [Kangiella sediminilitoris]
MAHYSKDQISELKKDLTVDTTLNGFPMSFDTTWGIFSPKSIDDGSIMLLKYLDVEPGDKCLDLGCGYGVLGLTMAKMAPQGEVIMVDKDYVAVDYAQRNARKNQLSNAVARLSNGFSEVNETDFNIIVSNIPAKVGNELLYIFLHDAYKRLAPGGRFYVVTITGLRDFMKRAFKEVFGNYKKHKQGPAYTVASATKE